MTESQEPPQRPPETPQSPAPPPPPAQPPAVQPEPLADYPVVGDIDRQEEYSRLLPLVKWLLAIPHFFALFFVGIAAFLAIVVSFFAVLFTRRYPRGLFDFVVGTLRWSWRLNAYLYLMRDEYPPFSLQEDPAYPARFDIPYPEEVDRWRPPFAWIVAIPYLLVASLLQSLAGLMALFAFFTILFTRNYPEGMFRIALIGLRWQARGSAYALWLVTRYPPFVWG